MSKPQTTTAKAAGNAASSPHIVCTGGGTGGHVIPCLTVISELKKLAPRVKISYVGSRQGVERGLVRTAGIPYYAVTTGKLRRYFSLANLFDAVRVPIGVLQALHLFGRLQPDVVFAKGGYVSVPVALAAGLLRIPLIIHESDITPGLATHLTAKLANKICVSFSETKKHLPKKKVVLTGNPVRAAGKAARGRQFLKFQNRKPIILITGGSTGARFLNELIKSIAPRLVEKANLVWLTGPGKKRSGKLKTQNLRVFEYLDKEYPDVLAAADLVICRAGAGTLFELATASKPSVLIPLPATGSRGDQLLNAEFFAQKGATKVFQQETIRPGAFVAELTELLKNKRQLAKMSRAVKKLASKNAAQKIAKIILQAAK